MTIKADWSLVDNVYGLFTKEGGQWGDAIVGVKEIQI